MTILVVPEIAITWCGVVMTLWNLFQSFIYSSCYEWMQLCCIAFVLSWLLVQFQCLILIAETVCKLRQNEDPYIVRNRWKALPWLQESIVLLSTRRSRDVMCRNGQVYGYGEADDPTIVWQKQLLIPLLKETNSITTVHLRAQKTCVIFHCRSVKVGRDILG